MRKNIITAISITKSPVAKNKLYCLMLSFCSKQLTFTWFSWNFQFGYHIIDTSHSYCSLVMLHYSNQLTFTWFSWNLQFGYHIIDTSFILFISNASLFFRSTAVLLPFSKISFVCTLALRKQHCFPEF